MRVPSQQLRVQHCHTSDTLQWRQQFAQLAQPWRLLSFHPHTVTIAAQQHLAKPPPPQRTVSARVRSGHTIPLHHTATWERTRTAQPLRVTQCHFYMQVHRMDIATNVTTDTNQTTRSVTRGPISTPRTVNAHWHNATATATAHTPLHTRCHHTLVLQWLQYCADRTTNDSKQLHNLHRPQRHHARNAAHGVTSCTLSSQTDTTVTAVP